MMGEMEFIKQGVALTIKQDGEVVLSDAIECDKCEKLSNGLDGKGYRDVAGELILWLCVECK